MLITKPSNVKGIILYEDEEDLAWELFLHYAYTNFDYVKELLDSLYIRVTNKPEEVEKAMDKLVSGLSVYNQSKFPFIPNQTNLHNIFISFDGFKNFMDFMYKIEIDKLFTIKIEEN